MHGRGCSVVDWEDELDKRLNPERQKALHASFSQAAIDRAMAAVIREEMPVRPTFSSVDDAFNYRFATTKGAPLGYPPFPVFPLC